MAVDQSRDPHGFGQFLGDIVEAEGLSDRHALPVGGPFVEVAGTGIRVGPPLGQPALGVENEPMLIAAPPPRAPLYRGDKQSRP